VGAYSTPPDFLAVFKALRVPASKGRGRDRKGRKYRVPPPTSGYL